MDQIVKNTTERLLRKLNPEQPFYTPSDMLEAGFPAFVVERIRLELETNLADSIVPPSTDWAIMNAEEVTGAWQQFLDAIHNQLRLPNSFAKGVIESSVADLVDILVEPRKNLPDYLFVSTEDLHQEEIDERMRWVVVYPHFASFLPRYMKAKKLDKISKERYAKAIAQIDDKLSERYSPLNWAQLLKPLFNLCNEELEPEVLGRFFRDKNMLREAARFEDLKDPVDDHQFIEVLSRPDFNDDSDTEFLTAASFGKSTVEKHAPLEEQDDEVEVEAEEKAEVEADVEEKPLYSTLMADNEDEDEDGDADDELKDMRRTTIIDAPAEEIEEENDSEEDTPETPEELHTEDEEEDSVEEGYISLQSHWASKQKSKGEGIDNDEEEDEGFIARPVSEEDSEDEENADDVSFSPLYSRFQQASEDDNEEDEESGQIENRDGINDEDEPLSPDDYKREVQGYETEKEFTEESDYKPYPSGSGLRSLEEDDAGKEAGSASDDDTEEENEPFIPLWQRLSVSDEEDEPGIPVVPAEEKEVTHRRETIENPEPDDNMAQKLINYLKNDRKLYIKEIFKNDEAAYIRALTVLSEFRSWRDAGKYLTNDIFRKNGIDMYKDVTVDFTDRLHKFFTDNMRR